MLAYKLNLKPPTPPTDTPPGRHKLHFLNFSSISVTEIYIIFAVMSFADIMCWLTIRRARRHLVCSLSQACKASQLVF